MSLLRRQGRPKAPQELSDDEIEARLAWIFGSPRTGSSWVLRMLVHPWMLANNPTRLVLPEGRRPPSGRGVVPVNESHLPMHLTPFQTVRPVRQYESQPDPAELIRNTARAGDPSYFFADQYERVWRPGMRQLALDRFRAQLETVAEAHRMRDPIVVIKEPNGSHGAELMMSLLPRSKLVFLFRDGRDVLDSQIRMRENNPRPNRDMAVLMHESQRSHFVKGHVRLWVNNMTAVQRAYDAHPPELRYRLRYERVLERPLEELRELTSWLGLGRTDKELRGAVEAQAFEKATRTRQGERRGPGRATPGLWRNNLTPEDLETFDEIAGDKLRELGYED